MTSRLLRLIGAVVLFAPSILSAQVGRSTTVPDQLPSYRLLDQFNRLVTNEAITRRAAIIIVAGRNGAAAAEQWTQRIRAAVSSAEADVLPVADLSGAPRMLRGMIRKMFSKDTTAAVALDWDGVIARPMRGTRAPLVAVVYGTDGRLKEWISLSTTQVDVATVQRLLAAAN